MNIDGVRTGIVLDHIKAGKGMQIYKYLGLDKLNCSVALLQRVPSTKYGQKDIIKINELIELNYDMLGYVDSNITVNFVKDGELLKKEHMAVPDTLTNIIECKNPRCITGTEQELPQVFTLADREERVYRCLYCEATAK